MPIKLVVLVELLCRKDALPRNAMGKVTKPAG